MVAPPRLPHAEIQRRLQALADHGGNKTAAAAALGIDRMSFGQSIRRGLTESAFGLAEHLGRIDLDIDDGVILIGSDAHIFPGEPTIAMRAFVAACDYFNRNNELAAVILNGDVLDGARISRHPSIGWEQKPTLIEELGACQTQLREIVAAAGDAELIWTLGNHDARFETQIANTLPDYAGVQGVHLKDHFPAWRPAWSCWVNNDLVVKHRFRGGIGAARNNTLNAGKSITTGHTHQLQVCPFTDYGGTRYGTETGTLSQPYGPAFVHYTEGNPVNWRAGFAVFTFYGGTMLQPELVAVRDAESWEFRGRVHRP